MNTPFFTLFLSQIQNRYFHNFNAGAMRTSSTRMTELFIRYYSGLATETETDELMHLIRHSGDDETLAELIKTAWQNLPPDEKEFSEEESEKMLCTIRQIVRDQTNYAKPETTIRPLGWVRYAAASAVLIISCIGLYWLANKPAKSVELAGSAQKATDLPPGRNRALLALSDGTQIVLDSTENGLLKKYGSTKLTKISDGELVISVPKNLRATDLQLNTLSTPKGGKYQITLQDGSKVRLNASSSIRFPTVFSDKNRTVEISGEAYFDVAREKNRPFKVKFGVSEVEVLGTSFNIMSYQDEPTNKTTLVEGSVKLLSGKEFKYLIPGQQGSVLSNGLIRTASIDTERETAWKDGIFYFKDSSVEEIMRQAARWYNVDVRYEGKIQRKRFTGKVSRNVPISELLTMLRYAGVNCEIQDKNVLVKM